MNGKRLLEVWKRGTDRLSDFFGSTRTSSPGTGPESVPPAHISLIVSTAGDDNLQDGIGSIITGSLEEERSAILLRTTGSSTGARRNPRVIDIERAGYRAAAYLKISLALSERKVGRILGIPQSAEDLLNAIAACDITAAPLVLWITEGYDFRTDRSESDLLDEALRKARLCFAASEPLRAEIQKRYGTKVWMIPSLNLGRDTENPRLSEVASSQLLNGLTDWIWKSLEAGEPVDDRFERLFSDLRNRLTPYVDPPAPKDIHWEMQPHFQALYRLRASGHKPDFVVDVGASTGYWSHIAQKIFPTSRYFLVEPLLAKYLEAEGTVYRLHPEFVKIEAAAGNVPGELEMNVSPDLYGSSFLDSSVSSGRPVKVRIRTLDEIAVREGIKGRGLLKIDVQFSEHLVLDGAIEFLKQVDAIFLEVSLRRLVPGCKIFVEIVDQLHQLGFEYRDYAGTWRDPATGELLQQDGVFARQNI
jgi:FkbM family methyltransferase